MSAARERRSSAARALLLIDVINPFNFEGGDQLLRHALPAAGLRLAVLAPPCTTAIDGISMMFANVPSRATSSEIANDRTPTAAATVHA